VKSTIASVFCTLTIFIGMASGLTFANQRAQAQTSKLSLSVPQSELLADKLPTPDELFERQQQEREIWQNRWQQQQVQRQLQQNLRFQQQAEQRQQQQFWLQQQQERQLQQFNQPK
jgi:hypothetical protein